MNKFSSKNPTVKGQPIYNPQGRVIGTVRGDCFYKSIAANHYLRVPPAIAFSCASLDQAEKAGATRVQVKDRDNGTIWRASIAHIREAGFPVHRAGFEPQIGLPLDGFTRQAVGQPLQTSLFEGL